MPVPAPAPRACACATCSRSFNRLWLIDKRPPSCLSLQVENVDLQCCELTRWDGALVIFSNSALSQAQPIVNLTRSKQHTEIHEVQFDMDQLSVYLTDSMQARRRTMHHSPHKHDQLNAAGNDNNVDYGRACVAPSRLKGFVVVVCFVCRAQCRNTLMPPATTSVIVWSRSQGFRRLSRSGSICTFRPPQLAAGKITGYRSAAPLCAAA